jgi:AcrR family transcriptional regulator
MDGQALVTHNTPKDELLAATIEYVAEHGMGELRLRHLAAAIGTSHRMLIYHFGSKQGLLIEVIRAMEQRQRDALAEFQLDRSLSVPELMQRMWDRLADPSLWPHERLFFEVYGQALQGRTPATQLLDGIVDSWVEPVAELAGRRGLSRGRARADARLQLAVVRGLLLDLLATEDRAGVDQAMTRFIAMYEAPVKKAAKRGVKAQTM